MNLFRSGPWVATAAAVLLSHASFVWAQSSPTALTVPDPATVTTPSEPLYVSIIDAPPAAAAEEKGPPLPFHSIEGYGGGAITPMAYLTNPPLNGRKIGKPSVALSYANLGTKNLETITVTENLFGRVELGYGANRFNLGNLPGVIEDATGVDIGKSGLWLHHFNLRAMILKEDDPLLGDIPLPAATVGVHVKYNDSVAAINDRVGGAFAAIGYRNDVGVDYTLTFTKNLKDALPRPVIITAGMRLSEAAQLGYFGFGDTYTATFEGNIVTLLTDHLVLAYEFRQKNNPYELIPGVVGEENNWHAFDLGLILSKHTTLVFGYGLFGNLANVNANSAWWLQLKHEF